MTTIAALIQTDPLLHHLYAPLHQTGLLLRLNARPTLTFFAPSAAAWFAAARTTDLEAVLSQHIVLGWHVAADLMQQTPLAALNGARLTVSNGTGLRVAGCFLLNADLFASNGVIHLIDGVLPLATL